MSLNITTNWTLNESSDVKKKNIQKRGKRKVEVVKEMNTRKTFK